MIQPPIEILYKDPFITITKGEHGVHLSMREGLTEDQYLRQMQSFFRIIERCIRQHRELENEEEYK